MDLVDEQDVPGLQVGQDGSQVAGPGDYGAGRGPESDPHLAGDDLRQGRLAEPRGAVEYGVVQGFGTAAGGGDEDAKVFADPPLADEVIEAGRPQAGLRGVGGVLFGGDGAGLHYRTRSPGAISARPARINASTPASAPRLLAAWATALWASPGL